MTLLPRHLVHSGPSEGYVGQLPFGNDHEEVDISFDALLRLGMHSHLGQLGSIGYVYLIACVRV